MTDVDEALGPLDVSESKFAARLRLHQAWFRLKVLHLRRFGQLPPPSHRPMGSVLHPDDASRGCNFVSPEAESLFAARRRIGWGIDPYRTTAVMTSSQALTINLFGPLQSDMQWLGRTMAVVLAESEVSVEFLEVEFAPQPRAAYLNDRTLIDAVVGVRGIGGLRVVAFETKLADRYTSRVLPFGDRYRELNARTGIWTPDAYTALPRDTNQLMRVHALAAALGESVHADLPPIVVLLSHPSDPAALRVVNKYRSHLNAASGCQSIGLDKFVAAMQATAESAGAASVVNRLKARYLDIQLSETHRDSVRRFVG